ncbi:hypothetical protein F2P56_011592 [Juglans regia]|uniref:Uncharacterized protein n=1 Tax=Juglans regia TaxID=51240 RepID=A0A834CUK3_JUGRE|nr:hypothetical protein F2P56_011592 [Juglans regia]
MGNAVSQCFGGNHSPPVKLIFWEGTTRILRGKHIAGEIMFEFPDKMVCHSDSFFIGHRVPALAIDDELQSGQTYLVLPIDTFACDHVISASSLAALGSSPKNSPINFGDCRRPFEYVKGADGRVLIKVVPEFITRLITRARQNCRSTMNSLLGRLRNKYGHLSLKPLQSTRILGSHLADL